MEHKEANVDVLDRDGDPPLVFALAAGSAECVRALIERGANVQSRLREGLGPSVAHICVYHGQPDCMHVCFMLSDNVFYNCFSLGHLMFDTYELELGIAFGWS